MEERKKILFIHESLAGGGAEKVFVDLMRGFDKQKYQVTVLLLYGGGTHQKLLPEELEVIILHEHRSLLHKIRNHFITTRDKMLRSDINHALAGRKFDTIVSYLEGPAMKVHSFIRHLGNKHISWIHANIELNHWTSFMFHNLAEERRLYSDMNDLVFVSAGARDAFSHVFNLNLPMHVIPNVIDRDEIVRRAAEDNVHKTKFTIVNVGRIEQEKRHDRLLKVARLLKDRGVDFEAWLLGEGTLEQQIKQMCTDLALDDCVKFLGFKSNPYPYMKAADLFLLTSDTEGWPTVVCEALSLGLPVVSTKVTGAEELLAGDAGILTNMNPEEIADKVYSLATNVDALSGYAKRSRERGKQFNPEEVLKRIYEII